MHLDKKNSQTMMGLNKKKITGKELKQFVGDFDKARTWNPIGQKESQSNYSVGDAKTKLIQDEVEMQQQTPLIREEGAERVSDDMRRQIREEEERLVSLNEQIQIMTSTDLRFFIMKKACKAMVIMMGSLFIGIGFMQFGSGGQAIGFIVWLAGFVVVAINAKKTRKARGIYRDSRKGR